MSPVVQRKRPAVSPAHSQADAQHWGMLVFESLSAGAMAVFVGFGAVIMVVGLYAIVIWPLTNWDLAGLQPEQFNLWAQLVLWVVFGLGSIAGYLCFSGKAFKAKQKPRVPASPVRVRQAVR